ncbi:MAG: FCD domain-containing protein [Spirochaetaceae bacterium]|nr:FCD domain-containing protein [Spirochaetaceae bacterium]
MDIFDYRCLIETFAVKRLIDNITPELDIKLQFFKSEFDKYSDYINIKKYIEIDSKFHQFLVDCSKNEIISDSFKN